MDLLSNWKFASALILGTAVVLSALAGCAGNSMENEAKEEAWKVMNQYVIKCGNVWAYYRYYEDIKSVLLDGTWHPYKGEFVEYTNIRLDVKDTTTEADKLNGLTWGGVVVCSFSGSLRAFKFRDSSWTEWREPILPESISLFARKKGNQWFFEWTDKDHKATKPISCSEIPLPPPQP